MLNYNFGKNLSVLGFGILLFEDVLWFLGSFFSLYFTYSIQHIVGIVGYIAIAIGFAICFLQRRDFLNLVIVSIATIFFLDNMFYFNIPTFMYIIFNILFFVSMIIHCRKRGNSFVVILLLASLLYRVAGVYIINLMPNSMFQEFLWIAGYGFCDISCVLYSLTKEE